jgi:hypothetical protein
MRRPLLPILALLLVPGLLGASSPELPRGNGDFYLGMSRTQVDSAVAARRLRVVSDGTAFLVCAGGDSAVEFEQYSFLGAPHGGDRLWKVTIGYRLTASSADYAAVREELRRLLGEPSTDTWHADEPGTTDDDRVVATTQLALWADGAVVVRLGARWTGAADPAADRMMVSWTDRRLQRLVEARRKKDRAAAAR